MLRRDAGFRPVGRAFLDIFGGYVKVKLEEHITHGLFQASSVAFFWILGAGGAIVLLFSLREVTYSSTGMSVVGENKALAWWASR